MPRQEDLRGDVLRARNARADAIEKGLSPWNPELARELYELLARRDLEQRRLDQDLQKLEKAHPEAVYPELLYLLCHLRFDGPEAKEHWERISEHRRDLQERLGSPVDLRVAVADYFIQVSRCLENPAVIEMRLLAETQAQVYRDELTGLRNYRYLAESLAQEVARSHQHHTPLSLLMIDIDDFKRFNDSFGHQAGNEALAAIGELIQDLVRIVDVPARFGGEEFAVVLPSTTKMGAGLLAQRLCDQIATRRFGADAEPGRLTVSIGVATCPADAERAAELLRCADEALYQAKSEGKNQIQLFAHDRRSHGRVRIAIQGLLRHAAEASVMTTVDLSEAGLKFLTDREVASGSLVDLELTLPSPHPVIKLAARVLEISPPEAGRFEVSARIVEMGSHDLEHLTRYLKDLPPSEV